MTPEQQAAVFDLLDSEISDIDFATICKERYTEAEEHWNKAEKLNVVRENNVRQYLSKFVDDILIDERYQDVFNDNRQFQAVRTLVPFVTGQLAAPEVTPANGDDLSLLFAKDYESALQKHGEKQLGKYKTRLSVQDLLIGKRIGILKWRYDAQLDTIVVERREPSKIVIGKRSALYEEPDYICDKLDRTAGDLVRQFPDRKQDILDHFSVTDSPAQLEKIQHEIYEEWIWLWINNERVLCVGWRHEEYVFGKMRDPNWKANGKNIVDAEMMPFVFINMLNDGSGYIDQTSFTEQSKYSQTNYNKRGQVIAESARYGGTGVPIFAKGAIAQKDAAKVRFSPVQRVLLDTADVTKAFTTWQQGPLQSFIVEDQANQKQNIADTYGTNNVFQGNESGNKTATQDVLNRNQAEGRQGDLLDMVELAMTRFYQLEAQLMYIYFTDTKYYKYVGNDNEFVSIAISSASLAKNIGIQIDVKAGSTMPLDRSQRRATVMQLLQLNKIGTLQAYKELGIFDDPEKAFKQYLEEQIAIGTGQPGPLLAEMDSDTFDRDANEDLQTVIGGKTPPERDDISPEYINFLNEWLLTDKYKLLREQNPKKAAAVSDFVDAAIAKAQRKAAKMALQPAPLAPGQPPTTPPQAPMPPDPNQPIPGGPPAGAPGQPPQAPPAANPIGLAGAIPSAAGAIPQQ